jgi:hypothetical protein
MNNKDYQENLLVASLSCFLAIVGILVIRMGLKLDFQSWSLVYLAAASTAAIRWTSVGAGLSMLSGLRSLFCLVVGLSLTKLAGYPGTMSLQTASMVPPEIMEALGRFHIFFD